MPKGILNYPGELWITQIIQKRKMSLPRGASENSNSKPPSLLFSSDSNRIYKKFVELLICGGLLYPQNFPIIVSFELDPSCI